MVIGRSARFHRPLNLTVGKTMSGKFAVLTTNMNRIASEAIASCPPCLRMRMERYRVPLGLTYTRVKNRVTPFEHVSIDPLMPIQTAAWIGSRKEVTLFPLLVKCINTGNIDILLMSRQQCR